MNAVCCCLLASSRWLGSQGDLDDGVVVRLVSPAGALPSRLQSRGVGAVGRRVTCVAVDDFQRCFSVFKACALARTLGGAGASFSTFRAIFVQRV